MYERTRCSELPDLISQLGRQFREQYKLLKGPNDFLCLTGRASLCRNHDAGRARRIVYFVGSAVRGNGESPIEGDLGNGLIAEFSVQLLWCTGDLR